MSYREFPVRQIAGRDKWLFGPYPAQSQLLVEMARWQESMTDVIHSASTKKSALRDEQEWYLGLMRDLVEITRGDMNLLHRTLICALMTLDVHARDVIELLAHENVETIDNFLWQKQLRYTTPSN